MEPGRSSGRESLHYRLTVHGMEETSWAQLLELREDVQVLCHNASATLRMEMKFC